MLPSPAPNTQPWSSATCATLTRKLRPACATQGAAGATTSPTRPPSRVEARACRVPPPTCLGQARPIVPRVRTPLRRRTALGRRHSCSSTTSIAAAHAGRRPVLQVLDVCARRALRRWHGCAVDTDRWDGRGLSNGVLARRVAPPLRHDSSVRSKQCLGRHLPKAGRRAAGGWALQAPHHWYMDLPASSAAESTGGGGGVGVSGVASGATAPAPAHPLVRSRTRSPGTLACRVSTSTSRSSITRSASWRATPSTRPCRMALGCSPLRPTTATFTSPGTPHPTLRSRRSSTLTTRASRARARSRAGGVRAERNRRRFGGWSRRRIGGFARERRYSPSRAAKRRGRTVAARVAPAPAWLREPLPLPRNQS